MLFKDFCHVVKEQIQEKMGFEYAIEIREVMKNNNMMLTGLNIIEPFCNITPTIYLEPYYKVYQSGEPLYEVIDKIIETYERHRIVPSGKYDMSFFMEYEKVKNNIIFKIVNKERNEELLKSIPYIEYFDLVIVFQYMISDDATILINNAHVKIWNVTADVLHEQALKNTPKLKPYSIRALDDIVREMVSALGIEAEVEPTYCPAYTLSNTVGVNGASCILYPHILEDFAKAINDDFYIIPSSIHENILLKASEDICIDELLATVKLINATELSTEDFLSNSVYIYKRKEGVSIINSDLGNNTYIA